MYDSNEWIQYRRIPVLEAVLAERDRQDGKWGVQNHVDPDSVGGERETTEEIKILVLTFPAISDVRIMRHQHHDASILIAD